MCLYIVDLKKQKHLCFTLNLLVNDDNPLTKNHPFLLRANNTNISTMSITGVTQLRSSFRSLSSRGKTNSQISYTNKGLLRLTYTGFSNMWPENQRKDYSSLGLFRSRVKSVRVSTANQSILPCSHRVFWITQLNIFLITRTKAPFSPEAFRILN